MTDSTDPLEKAALKRAIAKFATQAEFAAKIGKRQGHVGKWLHRDKNVPADVCVAIERATKGEVTRYELRPDVFGDPPKRKRKDAQQPSEAA